MAFQLNMKYHLLLLALSLLARISVAQSTACGCAQDFDFVVSYLERNLPAYRHDVTARNQLSYTRFKQEWRRNAVQATSERQCLPILDAYVEFFRDQHTSISGPDGPNVNPQDTAAVARFRRSAAYQDAEMVRLAKQQQQPLTAIEGQYQTTDSTYVIQIQPARTKFRDYVGVLVASRTPLWAVGQVKLELKRKPNKQGYRVIQYQRNHAPTILDDVQLVQGHLTGTSWRKVGAPAQLPGPESYPVFRQLTAATAYLRIPSFGGQRQAQLESVYRQVKAGSLQGKNLLIDVRGNGGGSDDNVEPLLPLLLTSAFQDDLLEEYYVTPDNIARLTEYYRGMQKDSGNYGAAALTKIRATLRWLRQAPPGQFLADPAVAHRTFAAPPTTGPARVAILYDRGCASSCETLLFWARHSTKTLLLGENSGGYVGYGNIFTIPTPCYQFQLSSTTLRLPNQLAYEVTGVPPAIRLTPDEDWLTQAVRIVEH